MQYTQVVKVRQKVATMWNLEGAIGITVALLGAVTFVLALWDVSDEE